MGLLGKRVGVTQVSLTGVPEGSHGHSGSLLQQVQVDPLTGRGRLLGEHRVLLILRDALSPPGIAAKASQQSQGSPQGCSDPGRTDQL